MKAADEHEDLKEDEAMKDSIWKVAKKSLRPGADMKAFIDGQLKFVKRVSGDASAVAKAAQIPANGFVGSNIYSLLHDQYNITTIGSADKIDFSDLNRVDNLLKDLRPDVVINCLTYGQKQTNGDMALEVAKNTAMFYNFLHCQNSFAQYINIGSGAEFDRTKNIDLALELDIHKVMPTDSYGFAKNLIARAIQTVGEKFITLRLFGCFGKNEWSSRFLKRFCSAGDKFVIDNDRYFDYISVDDFVAIIKIGRAHV